MNISLGGRSLKDYQRQRLYNAERKFGRWFEGSPLTRRIEAVPDIQQYVDDLVRKPEFRARFTQTAITVHDGRRRRKAGGSIGNIWMPRWSRSVLIILHEVAHGLSEYNHGPHFCRALSALVEIESDRHTAMLFEGYLRGGDCEVAPERPLRVKAAACERPKPLSVVQGGATWHTHPDTIPHSGPMWHRVHSRTGICSSC
jgi:hypothetical protein